MARTSLMDPAVRDRLKFEVADELGIQLERGYNGDIRARDAGRIGGKIGGNMVRVMIRHAEQELGRNRTS